MNLGVALGPYGVPDTGEGASETFKPIDLLHRYCPLVCRGLDVGQAQFGHKPVLSAPHFLLARRGIVLESKEVKHTVNRQQDYLFHNGVTTRLSLDCSYWISDDDVSQMMLFKAWEIRVGYVFKR